MVMASNVPHDFGRPFVMREAVRRAILASGSPSLRRAWTYLAACVKCLWLILRTRNWPELIRAYVRQAPCDTIVLRDGTRLIHPANTLGFVDTFLEVWFDRCYTDPAFYSPRDGDVVLDLGGNVGLFTILLARPNPSCRVVVVEPFEENFECLRRNVEAANLGNVEVRKAALAGERGTAYMQRVGQRSLDHRLAEVPDVSGADEVNTITLDDLVGSLQCESIALVKIDIEGSEHDAFQTVANETIRRVERFAIEYHDNLKPGTLALLRARLADTHEIRIRPSVKGTFGMLYGVRKAPHP